MAIQGNFRLHPGQVSEGCITLVHRTDFYRIKTAILNQPKFVIPGTKLNIMEKLRLSVMGRSVLRFLWFIVFVAVFICMARADYYFSVSESYRNAGFIYKLVNLLDVFPDGESMMNFKEWVLLHALIIAALLPFSIIRIAAECVIKKCSAFMLITKRWLHYYIKLNVIVIISMIILNVVVEILDRI